MSAPTGLEQPAPASVPTGPRDIELKSDHFLRRLAHPDPGGGEDHQRQHGRDTADINMDEAVEMTRGVGPAGPPRYSAIRHLTGLEARGDTIGARCL